MKRVQAAVLAAGFAAVLTSAACLPSPPPGAVYVRVPPPAARVEVSGVAPGPDSIWVDGYWVWRDSRYAWVDGRWDRRPRARARWVPGHWKNTRHGWYWVPGHWR
jgi:hypothetical protein